MVEFQKLNEKVYNNSFSDNENTCNASEYKPNQMKEFHLMEEQIVIVDNFVSKTRQITNAAASVNLSNNLIKDHFKVVSREIKKLVKLSNQL